jgi:hypothetical protein
LLAAMRPSPELKSDTPRKRSTARASW